MQRTMRMMDLALDLGTHIITTHIGRVPDEITGINLMDLPQ